MAGVAVILEFFDVCFRIYPIEGENLLTVTVHKFMESEKFTDICFTIYTIEGENLHTVTVDKFMESEKFTKSGKMSKYSSESE